MGEAKEPKWRARAPVSGVASRAAGAAQDSHPARIAMIDVMNLSSSESVTAVELRYRCFWRCDDAASSSAPRFTPRYTLKSPPATTLSFGIAYLSTEPHTSTAKRYP